MHYTVFDLETTTKAPPPHFAASPHWDDNCIVVAGFKHSDTGTHLFRDPKSVDLIHQMTRTGLLIGHNIKFDILHAAKRCAVHPLRLLGKVATGTKILLWDTSIAEYLLANHRLRMPSLDTCATRHGTPLKEAAVGALIKSGRCPSTIDPNMLDEYLKGDLEATEAVFLRQYVACLDRGLLNVVWATMEALVATTEMQYNGMHVDLAVLRGIEESLDTRVKELDAELRYVCTGTDVFDADDFFSFTSNLDVSRLLFGGTKSITVREVVGTYKNGKTKYQNVARDVTYKGFGLTPTPGTETKRAGIYSVDDDALKPHAEHPVVGRLLELRELSKLLGTYAQPVRTRVISGRLHGELHHNVTGTGRLSSSNPNLQNMPNHHIKRCFTSRYGVSGVILEMDFDQLEMIGLAVMSGDEQLIDDIAHGKDLHTELYRDMFGRNPTKPERKAFKPLSFGLVYGAGAKTLAANSGQSLAVCKRFIEVFYRRYPGVKEWHELLVHDANVGRVPSSKRDDRGTPLGAYNYRLPTGREYTYYEYTNDRGTQSFSPPELKNWPVQGFATADVVPFLLGRLARKLSDWFSDLNPRVVMINTIHDSIMFDCENETTALVLAKNLKDFFKSARKMVEDYYGVNQPLDFSVGIELGSNWYDKKEIK